MASLARLMMTDTTETDNQQAWLANTSEWYDDDVLPNFSLQDWLVELQYYVNEVKRHHRLSDIDFVMNSLEAIDSLLDELDAESDEHLSTEDKIDEILPIWFCYWVSTWQRYRGIEPNIITNLNEDFNETCH